MKKTLTFREWLRLERKDALLKKGLLCKRNQLYVSKGGDRVKLMEATHSPKVGNFSEIKTLHNL